MNAILKSFRVVAIACLCAGVTGCGGGEPSDAEIERLGVFIDAIDKNYRDHEAELSDGSLKVGPAMFVSMETRELELIEAYLAEKSVPNAIKSHLKSWRDGLNVILPLHQQWVAADHSTGDAPEAERKQVEDTLMQTTEAETALRIIAGR